jgi:Cdc6-like AAA superfamily ATPase
MTKNSDYLNQWIKTFYKNRKDRGNIHSDEDSFEEDNYVYRSTENSFKDDQITSNWKYYALIIEGPLGCGKNCTLKSVANDLQMEVNDFCLLKDYRNQSQSIKCYSRLKMSQGSHEGD